MTTPVLSDNATHDGLTCTDVEALLSEITAENQRLRDQEAARLAEVQMLRGEAERIRSLLADLTDKMDTVASERDGLDTQVQFLYEELKAAEAGATPLDTVVFSVVTAPQVSATYREVSQIMRGPLPSSINAAVDAGRDKIRSAMERAGQRALNSIIREQVAGRQRPAA